tara:strand:- start:29605 stop:30150 length:546 start_codon:yes stop_codon:yes gene_type:complete
MKKATIQFISGASVFVTLAFAVLCLMSWVTVETLPKAFAKKINKSVETLWGEGAGLKNYPIQENQKKTLDRLGIASVFEIHQNNTQVGFAVLAQARSKFEYFDYIVYYDSNKRIKAVRVLLYREDYGGEIASKRWLNQFDGKDVNSPLKIDEDIQGISGATISYRAITKGVKDITQIINEL